MWVKEFRKLLQTSRQQISEKGGGYREVWMKSKYIYETRLKAPSEESVMWKIKEWERRRITLQFLVCTTSRGI